MCVGKATRGTGSACVCTETNCHECAIPATSASDRASNLCRVCKNSFNLLLGNCVSKELCQLLGRTTTGRGNFGRRCEAKLSATVTARVTTVGHATGSPTKHASATCNGKKDTNGNKCTCTKILPHCHTCSLDAQGTPLSCTSCKNARVLDGDRCISQDACNAKQGLRVAGSGKFGLRCVSSGAVFPAGVGGAPSTCKGKKTSSGEPCSCTGKLSNCHVCGLDAFAQPTTCNKCKNGQLLHQGVCVSASDCTTLGGKRSGKGTFGNRCVFAAAGQTCTGRKTSSGGKCWCSSKIKDCHQCLLAPGGSPFECVRCKNGQALSGGTCVAVEDCPRGKAAGTGSFGRACID